MNVLDTIWLYFRYLPASLTIVFYDALTKPKLKENYFPSLKKPIKFFGTEFGFNLRQNEIRDNFHQSFEYLDKFKADWIRTDFPMSYDYEPDFKFADKIVSECQKKKIKLSLVLGSGMSCITLNTPKNEREANKFVRLVAKIARRYKNKVSAYEIWNEPNVAYFWRGNFKDFIELLRRSSFAIKKEASKSLVGFSLAYISGFHKHFKKIVSKQTLSNVDFFGMHGYPGSLDRGDFRSYRERILNIRDILKKVDCDIQVWATETGYVSFNSSILSQHNPKNQTKFLRGACKIFKKNRIPVVIWYRMRDSSLDVLIQKYEPYENRFGLLKKDFKPKDPNIFEIISKRLMFK